MAAVMPIDRKVVAKFVLRTTAASGVPERVEDVVVIERIADALRGGGYGDPS